MAVLAFYEPNYVGQGSVVAPWEVPYIPAQNMFCRRGDIMVLKTTGAITAPGAAVGVTATSTATGPGTGVKASVQVISTAAQAFLDSFGNTVTITGVASANAPQQTYYLQLQYTLAANNSASGPEIVINCAAGFIFSVNVSAAGAPVGATNYAAFVGLYPQNEVLQQASLTTTALGTAFSISNPLVNNRGIAQAATAANSNILGMAVNSSQAIFYSGSGGSLAVNEQSLFGVSQGQQPLQPNESFLIYVIKLQNSVLLEMSLTQAWSPALLGTAVGIRQDAATGWYVADTAQTACGTIIGESDGPPTILGQAGDVGKRVLVTFTPSVLI